MDWIRPFRTYSELSAHRKSSSDRVASGRQNRGETPPSGPARRGCRGSRLQRILIIRFSGSIAFRRPGMRRDRLWFPGFEHCRLVGRCRAEPARRRRVLATARLAIPPSYPHSGIFLAGPKVRNCFPPAVSLRPSRGSPVGSGFDQRARLSTNNNTDTRRGGRSCAYGIG